MARTLGANHSNQRSGRISFLPSFPDYRFNHYYGYDRKGGVNLHENRLGNEGQNEPNKQQNEPAMVQPLMFFVTYGTPQKLDR